MYVVNQKNPYCAFWIYDRHEFALFIKSPHWNLNLRQIKGYDIREMSAIGLHVSSTE